MTFVQWGVFASSRSANETRAPEFTALVAIFGGPVISTFYLAYLAAQAAKFRGRLGGYPVSRMVCERWCYD
jgi:hypothetical protein